MRKSDLLRALQQEIGRHDFSTFLDAEPSFANGGPGDRDARMSAVQEAVLYDVDVHPAHQRGRAPAAIAQALGQPR